MDQLESNSNVIVKQELIIEDLQFNDYEHLLREYYYDQPDHDESQADISGFVAPPNASGSEVFRNTSLDSVRCASQSIPAQTAPLEEGESLNFLLETFDEEHPSYVQDNLMEDLPRSVIVKEEFVFEEHDETSLVDVLYSTAETKTVEPVKSSKAKQKIKRPEYAETCPVRKVWNHTVTGLENHLLRHHGRQLTEGKQKAETQLDHVKDDLTDDLATSASMKEEFVLEGHDDTSLIGVLYSTEETKTVKTVKNSKAKQKITQIKRPECAQRCPVCKSWYHTVAGLENHLQRIHGRPLTEGKQKAETQPGHVEDNLKEDLSSLTEEFALEEHDETSFVDVLYSTEETKTIETVKSSEAKQNVTQIKRPEHAQRCPVCKVWYHTVAGLENHLQRHHGRQLMEGKQRTETQVSDKVVRVDKSQRKTKKTWHCARCDKTFTSYQQYNLHEYRHTNIDSGRFKCNVCSKSLGSKQELTKHENSKNHAIQSKSSSKSNNDLLEQAEPCLIVLEDVLRRKKYVKSLHPKRGRQKGSRQCPLCKLLFPTQEELQVHFAIHNQSVKATQEDFETTAQNLLKQADAMQTDDQLSPDTKESLDLTSEPFLNERRKVGRPKGSKKRVSSEPDQQRMNGLRQGIRKVGRPEGSQKVKSEPDLQRMIGLRQGIRKVGRPKGSLKVKRVIEELHERRKVGRPKKSANSLKIDGVKQRFLRRLRKRVGRPKTSESSSKVSHPAEAQSTQSFAYCARCDKEFPTNVSFENHQLRHRNVDLGRFPCVLCKKAFASKVEQVAHKQNGHKLKTGRPKHVRRFREKVDEVPTRRKVGRPRKIPATTCLDKSGPKRKAGRPRGYQKCPLCKVWFRTGFEEHLRGHVEG